MLLVLLEEVDMSDEYIQFLGNIDIGIVDYLSHTSFGLLLVVFSIIIPQESHVDVSAIGILVHQTVELYESRRRIADSEVILCGKGLVVDVVRIFICESIDFGYCFFRLSFLVEIVYLGYGSLFGDTVEGFDFSYRSYIFFIVTNDFV